jgi:hypothetical protein
MRADIQAFNCCLHGKLWHHDLSLQLGHGIPV